MIKREKYTIGWIPLKIFNNDVLLYQMNYTILLLLERVDISQLEHPQISLIKKIK